MSAKLESQQQTAAADARVSKTPASYIINSVIGVLIMILFRFLPIDLYGITPVGMEIIGIFIGTLYLWSTVDPLWSSLVSAFMVGISNYAPMVAVLKELMGNPTLVQLFFLMIVIGCLVVNKITLYIGRFFLTRKIINGRPWVFTAVILSGAVLMATFISPFAPIFLLWPVIYSIFDEVGFTKQDKYPKILVVLVVMASLIGFPIPPFMSNGLALLSNYRTITGDPALINDAGYMATGLIVGFLMLTACILFTKYILRPDVGPLKDINVDMLKKNPLPPLDLPQKIIITSFVALIMGMLLPSVFPSAPGMSFLKNNSTGLALGVTGVLTAIRIRNKPLLNVTEVMATQFSWPTLFLCASAILIGGVLTDESTGIVVFLNHTLTPLFQGMSPLIFTICVLLVAGILTNICNSLVIGMILQPVIATYCSTTGANAAPIVTVMILFVLLSAAVTPAASPFAAILHGNKEWLTQKDIYKYTLCYVGIELIIILFVGIPLANIMV